MKIEKMNLQLKNAKLNLKDEFNWSWNPNFKGGFKTICLLGTRGSGKTYSCLKYLSEVEQDYDFFYIISPTRESDIKQKRFFNDLELKKNVRYYDRFTESNWQEIVEEMTENKELHKQYLFTKNLIQKYKSKTKLSDDEVLYLSQFLLFEDDEDFDINSLLDDFPDYIKQDLPVRSMIFLEDSVGEKLLYSSKGSFLSWFIKHRHYYASICMLVQSFLHIPRAIRTNIVLWFIFQQKDEKMIHQDIYQEIGGAFDSKEQYLEIMNLLRQRTEHEFLMIDTSSMKFPDIRFNFNEKIILEN